PVPRLPRWWPERVAYLTDGAQPEPGTKQSAANRSTAAELLRAVARRAAAADRDGLRRDLADAPAPVGLDLAALAPGGLHRPAPRPVGPQPEGGGPAGTAPRRPGAGPRPAPQAAAQHRRHAARPGVQGTARRRSRPRAADHTASGGYRRDPRGARRGAHAQAR